jgi:hypothetical protein
MPANLPYPLQFDPSQMKNPYTQWAGVGMPWYGSTIDSSGTYGNQVPTDAMGQPIQSYVDANATAQSNYQQQQAAYQAALAAYNAGGGGSSTPGTTINNTGGSSAASGLPQAQQDALGQWGPAISELTANYQASPEGQAMANNPNAALMNYIQGQDQNIQAYPQGNAGGYGSGNSGPLSAAQRDMMTNNAMQIQQLQAQGGGAAPTGPAPPTAPTPPNMTQAYISALQKPNYVVTPGANVAQAQPPSQQSNVLQQFLANWQQGGGNTQGAGNYNNKGFFNGLAGNV